MKDEDIDNFVGLFPSNHMKGGWGGTLVSILDIEPKQDIFFFNSFGLDELDALSNTARNFLYFIQAFGNKLKLHNFANIWVVEDRVQDLDSMTCDIFQLYIYDNLFNPNKNSKIQDEASLNKRTIETLLNIVFVLDNQDKYKDIISQYAIDNGITVTYKNSNRYVHAKIVNSLLYVVNYFCKKVSLQKLTCSDRK